MQAKWQSIVEGNSYGFQKNLEASFFTVFSYNNSNNVYEYQQI